MDQHEAVLTVGTQHHNGPDALLRNFRGFAEGIYPAYNQRLRRERMLKEQCCWTVNIRSEWVTGRSILS